MEALFLTKIMCIISQYRLFPATNDPHAGLTEPYRRDSHSTYLLSIIRLKVFASR